MFCVTYQAFLCINCKICSSSVDATPIFSFGDFVLQGCFLPWRSHMKMLQALHKNFMNFFDLLHDF